MATTAFIFFHYGNIPRYLRYAMQMTRVSNPQTRCILICDQPEAIQLDGVEAYPLTRFTSPKLEAFRDAYVHVSIFEEKYERFVLERWFQIDLVRRELGIDHVILIDSDVLVFRNVDSLIKEAPPGAVAINGHSPHFSLIRDSFDDFLDYIINAYSDKENVARGRRKAQEAKDAGTIWTLGEMTIILEYLYLYRDMVCYPSEIGGGYICTNIHVPEGFSHINVGRRSRKKVFWARENERLIPYFQRESGERVPAFTIHCQGKAKQLMTWTSRIESMKFLSPAMQLALVQRQFNAA